MRVPRASSEEMTFTMLKDKGGAAAAAANFPGSKQAVLETVVNKPVGGVERCPPADSALFLLVALPRAFPASYGNSGLERKEQKGVLFVTSKPFQRMWQSPLASFFFGSQFSSVDCKHRHNSGEGLAIFYKVLD